VTRVPSDRSAKLEAIAAAERLAGTVRRHLLTMAQASLRMVREILAHLPPDAATAPRARSAEPAPSAAAVRPTAAAKPAAAPPPAVDVLRTSGRLPASYGSDRLVLLARDPHCLYAYWDLSSTRDQTVRTEAASDRLRMVLRTYDVTQIAFDAEPPRRFQDFAVSGDARSLYAYVGKPAACFVAEIGYLRADGAFFPVARSLPIWTPRTDQPGAAPGRWMTVGWNEQRDAGEVVPLTPTGSGSQNAATPAHAMAEAPGDATRSAAPSSWPGPAPSAAQRGSWSLIRGGLASPTTVDAPPPARHDR
jgi:hypothetical protein